MLGEIYIATVLTIAAICTAVGINASAQLPQETAGYSSVSDTTDVSAVVVKVPLDGDTVEVKVSAEHFQNRDELIHATAKIMTDTYGATAGVDYVDVVASTGRVAHVLDHTSSSQ